MRNPRIRLPRGLLGALLALAIASAPACGSDGGGGGGGSSDTLADAGGGSDAGGGGDATIDGGGLDVAVDTAVDSGGGGDDAAIEDTFVEDTFVEDTGGGDDTLADTVEPDTVVGDAGDGGGGEDVSEDTAGPAPVVVAANQEADPPDQVTIDRVVAVEDGWIAVFDDDAGSPGPTVLGFVAVSAGETTDVVVPLDREVMDGETLWAMLHVDAGTIGTFEYPGDDAPVSVDGAPVMAGFVVTVDAITAYVVAEDQVVEPLDQVVVAEVFSIGPGWVVIHSDDAGAPGDVLGHAGVPDGRSEAITVSLSRDLEDGENVWAMLHIDAGAVGTFEFPGVDAPAVLPNDAFVMDSFVVTVIGETTDPAVTAEDQIADPPNEVTIATVDAPSAGWIVVREDDDGAPGADIGFEAVLQGRNSGVVVMLDRDLEDGETLWAVLHVDTGQTGLYEYPDADDPVTDADGQVVMDSFVVEVTVVDTHVIAEDQLADPANRVVVAEVLSGGMGWVVIHEDNAGEPGAIVGHHQVLGGLNEDVVVELVRDATDGETLHAMLHVDEGVVGTFEFPGADAAVLGDDGTPVMDSFVVSVPPPPVDPYLVASDQELTLADEVFVDEVFSVGPGWVVIHEDDGGAPGAIIGRTSVFDGETVGVYVFLDRPALDGETLHAMLHVDAGEVGTFEFPGADVPATDGEGAVVVQSFVVTVTAGPEPFVIAEDQTLEFSPSEVTVSQVSAAENGWVAIYDDAAGEPGTVIGNAPVFEGDNFDTVVLLDRDAVDGETLWAVLHVDLDPWFIFDYPGVDVPVTDSSGDPVRDSFVVTLP